MFSCEFCDIFNNTFFTEHLLATASGMCMKCFANHLTGFYMMRTLNVRELKVTFTLITFCPNLRSFFFDILFSFCNVNFGILCNGFQMIGASVVSPILSCISFCALLTKSLWHIISQLLPSTGKSNFCTKSQLVQTTNSHVSKSKKIKTALQLIKSNMTNGI